MKRIAIVLVLVAACGGANKKPEPARPDDPILGKDAAVDTESVDLVEHRLLQARALKVTFDITADGAHTAKVQGELQMTKDNQARWRVSGTFDGNPLSIDKVFTAADGAALTEAIVLGWTRMGLLHNIAQLAQGKGIERAAGGIGDLVAITEPAPLAGGRATLPMDIIVDGKPMGHAELEIDSLGLPARRVQTVNFPTGDMHVEEHYGASTPDAIAASVFTPR